MPKENIDRWSRKPFCSAVAGGLQPLAIPRDGSRSRRWFWKQAYEATLLTAALKQTARFIERRAANTPWRRCLWK